MKLNIKWKIFRPLMGMSLKMKFGYRYKKAYNLPDNYIVLANYTTQFDSLFISASFPKPLRFVVNECDERKGFLFNRVNSLAAPIFCKKGEQETVAIDELIKTGKEGGNVAMFPEGVRSWDGTMSDISPSIAEVVKELGCGLVTYRIVGGYFTSPIWSKKGIRKGAVYGEPVNVYTKEQLKAMSEKEVYDAILDDISVDAYEEQLKERRSYRGKRLAEQIESLLYICPKCGAYDSVVSKGNQVTCKHCNLHFTYDSHGMIDNLVYSTIKELSQWQKDETKRDVAEGKQYEIIEATLSKIEDGVATPIAEGRATIDREELYCNENSFRMVDIKQLKVCGKREIVFEVGETQYELISTADENVWKFFLYYKQYQKEKKKVSRKPLFSVKQFSIIKS